MKINHLDNALLRRVRTFLGRLISNQVCLSRRYGPISGWKALMGLRAQVIPQPSTVNKQQPAFDWIMQ